MGVGHDSDPNDLDHNILTSVLAWCFSPTWPSPVWWNQLTATSTTATCQPTSYRRARPFVEEASAGVFVAKLQLAVIDHAAA